MTFLHPWWLLLLPIWPLLVLLMRAREQRAIRPAPDFLLWQRAAARLPQAASRARLSFRDALWIVPLVLLTLGLADPELRRSPQALEVLVLVDRSASMGTKGQGGATRLERGLVEARRILGARPWRLEGVPSAGPVEQVSVATVNARDLVESAVMTHAAGVPVLVVTDLALPDLLAGIGLIQVADSARNAGIVSAGFDPYAGLLVGVEADPGSGPRTLTVRDGGGVVLASRPLEDPTAFRMVIPATTIPVASSSVVVRLDPEDALRLDDEVRLVAARRSLKVAIEKPAPSVERALRACPGVDVISGSEPGADLLVGAPPRGKGYALLVPPIADVAGFETGAPAEVDGLMSGSGPFAGLVGPTHWRAVFPLVKEPGKTERLLEIGRSPLLVRHERTFALLADPDAGGWASVPSFPLTIARIVEMVGTDAGTRLEARSAVLSAAETHVARGEPLASRAPAVLNAAARSVVLAPWCYAAALLVILGLVAPRFTSRRGGARPRTRPASVPVAATHRTVQS